MKKTLLLAFVLTPLALSSTGCATKRIKKLEAELIACRESRTKLLQQQRSEVDTPADAATAEEQGVQAQQPARHERTVTVAARDEEECSMAESL